MATDPDSYGPAPSVGQVPADDAPRAPIDRAALADKAKQTPAQPATIAPKPVTDRQSHRLPARAGPAAAGARDLGKGPAAAAAPHSAARPVAKPAAKPLVKPAPRPVVKR
jgi:hypothetical protein